MHPHGVSVGALELREDVDHGLHPIVANRQISHVGDRRAEVGAVDDDRLTGNNGREIPTEHRRANATDLQSRFAVVGA